MAWCSEHDCPDSICSEYDHGMPTPVRVVGAPRQYGKSYTAWQRVALAAKQTGRPALIITDYGAFQVKHMPEYPHPPVVPVRPRLKPVGIKWWQPSTWWRK